MLLFKFPYNFSMGGCFSLSMETSIDKINLLWEWNAEYDNLRTQVEKYRVFMCPQVSVST